LNFGLETDHTDISHGLPQPLQENTGVGSSYSHSHHNFRRYVTVSLKVIK